MGEPKNLKIPMLVDFMASELADAEDEYNDIRGYMTELFPDCELVFTSDVFMHVLREMADIDWDVFVMDWGGVLPGCEDLTRSIYKTLLYLIREKEDKLFIMWSAHTEAYYKEAIEEEFPEFIAPNVVFRQDEHYGRRCRLFFGLPEVPSVQKPYEKFGKPGKLITPPGFRRKE